MVLAIMVIPYAAVRAFKGAGYTVRDFFGHIASIREQHPEKPVVGVILGHPGFVEDMTSLCGPSLPIFGSPEPAAKALATLWSYSRNHPQS
jgi:acyl-CoA synthetase (NDP forming)